ncbi:MAG: 6,7-dimethyl-8-ribityllumazine synthase [Flavobacteriales bacterium]|nr:6,7-dimethyl-8-ribityllumazine synthase [Flavobacteriales bacterium]
MATSGKNLSQYSKDSIPSASSFTFGIVVSEWNEEITSALASGAKKTLLDCGAREINVHTHWVPGSFELPTAAKMLIDSGDYDAVIAVGSVVKGETDHFQFVCQAVAQGVKEVSLNTGVPVIFCVLTDNTIEQARERSGGKHGNKGIEAAVAAVKMAALRKKLH